MMRFVGRMEDGRFASHPPAERHHRCRTVWRGFIANRHELLSEAARRGDPIRTGSPGELFALAYRWWGDALQTHVVGEYSLALFDESTSALLLTHDAFGLVPLFYQAVPQGVVFGSHLEDLVGDAGCDDLDHEYIADYVADCFYPSRRTPYRTIQRLGFGQAVVCSRGRTAEPTLWKFADAPVALADDHEYEEEFESLLDQAVGGAIEAEGAVWTELSGGLDSSTVAAFAARRGGPDLAAISLVYSRYAKADESKWMQLLLDEYPLPWIKVDGDAHLPFAALPDRFCAEPGLPMIDWSWRRSYEEIVNRNGVAAVLTGQGGDFVLFGLGTEPYYLADLLRSFKLERLTKEVAGWQAGDRQRRSFLFWLVNYSVHPLLNYVRRPPRRPGRRAAMSPWIGTGYSRRMALAERVGRTLPGDYTSVEQCWFVDTLSKMCGRIANLNQVPETFEFRHPLLHRPLVEFMLGLPARQKFNPEMNRFLQRRALCSVLPEALRLRFEKTTFDQPFYEGLRKSESWASLLTTSPRVAELGIIDRAKWGEAVAQAKMGRTHSLAQFQAVATLEIWLRQLETRASNRRRLEMPMAGAADDLPLDEEEE